MPDAPGKSLLHHYQSKPLSLYSQKALLLRQVMSRASAIRRIKQLLESGNAIPQEVIELLSLFHLHVDELTESEIPYEMVRAIEQTCPLLIYE